MTLGSNPDDDKQKLVSLMENKNSKSGKTSLLITEQIDLADDFSSAIRGMMSAVSELEKIKILKNILYHVSKNGDLSIDVPQNMSDTEAANVNNKVSDLDSTYNERLNYYKRLLDIDKAFNKGEIGKGMNPIYKATIERHKDVFNQKN